MFTLTESTCPSLLEVEIREYDRKPRRKKQENMSAKFDELEQFIKDAEMKVEISVDRSGGTDEC